MLMCLASSLVGVIVFLRKRSLVGETLSHAAYPGVILSIFFSELFFSFSEEVVALAVLIGAFITAFLGLQGVNFLEKRRKVKNDSALSFILSLFFGVGVLFASRLQITHAVWYKQAQLFLYGQAATMTDVHILIYGTLSLLIATYVVILYRHLKAVNFDTEFSSSIGLASLKIERMTTFFLVLSIVVGIRSVGVVLMAGMLIAPAAAARPFTKRLSSHFFLSGVFGLISGFLGNYLSITIPNGRYSLPTGPMILLSAAGLCLLGMLFASKNGLVIRFSRAFIFRRQCKIENSLKALWKRQDSPLSFGMICHLKLRGWIQETSSGYKLTPSGRKKAERVIRLHRLWEVYLVDYMGQSAEKVHHNAEELEHLFTPELERELTALLQDPKRDPHHQPIPAREGLV
jgi:manganese/zinc/iron transport system permease protein